MRQKKTLIAAVGGTGALAALMVVAATAFACTTYQGKFTVNDGNSGISISQGDNNCPPHGGSCGAANGSMTYCGSVVFGAKVNHAQANTVTLSEATTDNCTATGQHNNSLIANTTMDVLIITSNAYSSAGTIDTDTSSAGDDCMEWDVSAPNIITIDSVKTDAAGHFSGKTVSIPATSFTNSSSTKWAGICISQQGANSDYGSEAPINYF